MTRGAIPSFQIGKAAVSPAVVQQLNRMLEHHKHIRIAALAASGRNRESIQRMAEELTNRLAHACEYRIIGFTIVLRRRISKGS